MPEFFILKFIIFLNKRWKNKGNNRFVTNKKLISEKFKEFFLKIT